MASIALTVFAEQLLYELGIGPHLLFVAIITIDEHKQVGSAEFYLCALMVARRRACQYERAAGHTADEFLKRNTIMIFKLEIKSKM